MLSWMKIDSLKVYLFWRVLILADLGNPPNEIPVKIK